MLVACPVCSRSTAVPQPWPHAGYLCACGAAVAVAAAPAPAAPFDLADAPARPVRRRRAESAHPLLPLGGFLCALFSLVVFPPALGLAGCVFGAFTIAQRSVGVGMLVVVASLVCASVGAMWGLDVFLYGRPRFLLR